MPTAKPDSSGSSPAMTLKGYEQGGNAQGRVSLRRRRAVVADVAHMGDEAAGPPPVMQVAGGGLHDPGGRAAVLEVERDLVGGGGGGRHHRAVPAHHDRAMDVAADDALDLWVAGDDGAEGGAVGAVDGVHLAQAGDEGR